MAKDAMDASAGYAVAGVGFATMMFGVAGGSSALFGNNPPAMLTNGAVTFAGAGALGAGISMLLIR